MGKATERVMIMTREGSRMRGRRQVIGPWEMWDSKSYERKGILARVAFEFYLPQEICVKV